MYCIDRNASYLKWGHPMTNKPTVTTKGRYQLQYRGNRCLNCEHPLDMSDRYCPNCSQANSTKKLSLKDFFDEFFSSLISYDSKLLKTLSALLLRPGRITRDYIEGKRASYTNPFRFLLSLAIVYFLMLNFSGNLTDLDRFGESANKPIEMTGPFSFMIDSPKVDEIREGLEQNQPENGDSIKLNSWNTKSITENHDSIILKDPKAHFQKLDEKGFFERLGHKSEFFNTLLRKDSVYNFKDVQEKYQIEASFENKKAFNASRSALKVSRRPGTFISSMISKLPFLIFFFLPFFALFIWLMYIRKKYTYTDHLIFSFHNQSLLFILLIISFLLDTAFDWSTNGIFLLIFSIYLYKAMRNFYRQGRFKTIVKYLFFNTIFIILATLSIVVFLTGSLITF